MKKENFTQFDKPEKERGDLFECRIAVVIPAYKVTEHIVDVVSKISSDIWRIYVIDDACPDQSGKLVENQVSDPRVHVLYHLKNQGVGGAILTGYREALADGAAIIVKVDGDGQMDPTYLRSLVDPIIEGKADYTKGNRFIHSYQLKTMPVLRQFGNIGLSFLTKLASGYWNIFDPTNGYTAISASVMKLMDIDSIDQRFFFETSLLLELGLIRAVIRDVYIPARYGNEISQLSELNALISFPPRLLKGFFKRIWIQYFVRDFELLTFYLISGLTLLGFGGLFGLFHWWLSSRNNIATPTGTIMLAVLPIIVGVQLLIQAGALDVQNTPHQVIHKN